MKLTNILSGLAMAGLLTARLATASTGAVAVESLTLVESLIQFAEARGHTILELAFGWLTGHPAVASVIAGATSSAQIESNFHAAGWRLSDTERTEVEAILPPA